MMQSRVRTASRKRASIRSALSAERPLATPLAHDALSARLIERAGFNAFSIGGSAMLAARYAYPDIGLIGLADMVHGIRDIAAASSLPFLADADDGYGDVKSIVRTVTSYEAIGVGGLFIEDQERDNKQQRADKAIAVVDVGIIEKKLRTALASRSDPEMLIIGRTDAYGLFGLDVALGRADRFLSLGADGVFVAGLRTPEDYERVGARLKGAFLSAAMFEVDGMPWISVADLGAMGFAHVSFPVSTIFRATEAMRLGLEALRRHATGAEPLRLLPNTPSVRMALDDAVNLARWRSIEAGDGTGEAP